MTWSKIRVGTIGSTYPSGLSFDSTRFSCDDEKVVTTNPSLYSNNQPIPPSKDDKTPPNKYTGGDNPNPPTPRPTSDPTNKPTNPPNPQVVNDKLS